MFIIFLQVTSMLLTGVSLISLLFTVFFGGFIIFTADPTQAKQKKGFQKSFYNVSQYIFWSFLTVGILFGLIALGYAFISLL